MMFGSFPRVLVLASFTLALAACASTGEMQGAKDAYDDKISSALERAAGEADRQGANNGSLVLMEKVYKRDPKNPDTAVKYARALRNAGDLQKSLLVLEPFASKPDAEADVLAEFAALNLSLEQYPTAETFARKAVAKDPGAYRAYQVLGISLDAQNKYTDAEAAFRKALEIWQGDPIPVMNNLALNLTNQERLDEALEIMERAKKEAPNRVEVERNLRIIRTLSESASGRPAPKPAEKPSAKPVAPVSSNDVPADGSTAAGVLFNTNQAAKPADVSAVTLDPVPAKSADKSMPIVTSDKTPAAKAPAGKAVPIVEPAKTSSTTSPKKGTTTAATTPAADAAKAEPAAGE